MAQVPTTPNRSVLPSAQALPYSDPNSGYASSQAINKAVYNAGSTIQEGTDYLTAAMDKLQAEDDKREFRKLDTEYSAYVRLLTYGDGTAENPGFLNQKGENAIAAYKGAQAALQKKQADLTKLASNVRVKDMFTATATDRYDSTMGTYLNHTADERQKANDAVSQARIDEAIMDAASNWANPQATERSLAIVQGEIADAAVRNGLPKEAAQAAFKKASNDLLERTITAAAITSPGAATTLLAKYGAEMDGFTVAAMKDKIHSQNMEKLRDADYFEAHKAKELAKEQDKNLIPIIGQINAGQKTDAQLFDDLNHQTIDLPGFTYALNYKKAMLAGETKSNPEALYETDAGIRTGLITSYSQIQDLAKAGIISYKDAETKNALLQEMINSDPVLSRADVKQGTEFIKNTLGPQPSLTGLTDEDQKQRFANALEEYQNKAKANPNQNMQNLYHMIVDSYRPKPVTLLALPKPRFAPIGYTNGSPEQISDALKQAAIDTSNATDMSQAEKDKEIQKITDYLSLVDQMASTPTVDTGAQQ